MATKIKLGQRPKSFKKVITFQMLDGTTGSIEVEYKYRTRTEYGQLVDEIAEASGQKIVQADDGKFSMTALMKNGSVSNAEYVMRVVDGWNLDEELNLKNVQQLADELPAAVIAMLDSYRNAITEGRLGN